MSSYSEAIFQPFADRTHNPARRLYSRWRQWAQFVHKGKKKSEINTTVRNENFSPVFNGFSFLRASITWSGGVVM